MIDLWESLFRTLSALAIVLVLMGLVAMAARRLVGNRLGVVGARPLVRVLASGYIAPRKTIALVSVAGEYLIVGATATDLVPLGRVTDTAMVREMLASAASDASSPSSAAAPLPAPSSGRLSRLHSLSTGFFRRHKGRHGEQ